MSSVTKAVHVTFQLDEISRTKRSTEIHTNDSMKEIDAVSKEHRNGNNAHTDISRVQQSSEMTTVRRKTLHFEVQIESLIKSLRTYFPEEAVSENIVQLKGIVEKSYALADEVFHAEDAEIWGNGFEVSEDLVLNDENLFKSSMQFVVTVMTIRRQKQLSPNRLNRQRVEACIRSDNPEREKLFLLAEKGMPILLRPGFEANGKGKLPPLRKT